MNKTTTKKLNFIKKYKDVNINGFRLDIASYLYGFRFGDEYPKMNRITYNADGVATLEEIGFFKHYDRSAEYYYKIHTFTPEESKQLKNNETFCYCDSSSEKTITPATRFNFNDILNLCSNY